MSQKMTLRAQPSDRKGLSEVFTRAEALGAGFTRYRLYALRDADTIVALGGGVFRWADAEPADLDLIEIIERVPRATLCLETALARHELIDTIPSAIDVAIPRGNHRTRLNARVRLHNFDPPSFDIGRDTFDVGARTPLGVYSAERSIIDMVRLRYNQGSDLTWEALRRWLDKPGASPAKLMKMAKKFKGAETALRTAFEILR